MGIKFAREYKDIIDDLMEGVNKIDNLYDFFEMSEDDWNSLEEDEQRECIRTLCDDVFYGLGTSPTMNVGHGVLKYDSRNHIIKVFDGDNNISIVKLI